MGEVEDGKICAILSWFFPIGLIWFFVDEKMKKNKFVGFHVKQSLVLAIISIVLSVIIGILSMFFVLLALIPYIGWIISGLFFLLVVIIWLIMFIFWIVGLIAAIQGKTKELPLIGKYGLKFKF